MTLTKRLSLIASLVPDNSNVCDVGTDHAYLPIMLMKSRKARRVIATDIRPLPLENARKNIALSGVGGIETRLCDGLSSVKKSEADTVISFDTEIGALQVSQPYGERATTEYTAFAKLSIVSLFLN